jgi:RNA polymerase sigma-70 factor (ECF subfamily)
VEELLERARRGDSRAVIMLIASQREKLERFVAPQLDRRLAGRIDAADVVQDVLLEATTRFDKYLAQQPPMPFSNWICQLARDRVKDEHKRHHARIRDIKRESRKAFYGESDDSQAPDFAAEGTSPSSYVGRKEIRERLHALMEQLNDADRVVLQMRFFDQIPVQKICEHLRLSDDAVRLRQLRGIRHLRVLLQSLSVDS